MYSLLVNCSVLLSSSTLAKRTIVRVATTIPIYDPRTMKISQYSADIVVRSARKTANVIFTLDFHNGF